MSWSHYKNLIVWQKSMQLVTEAYTIVSKLPKEEIYVLSDQIRRSAVSIPSNIAEGHGRNTEKEFKQFLSIAKASTQELETQLQICINVGYISSEESEKAISLCVEVEKMLTKIIDTFSFSSND